MTTTWIEDLCPGVEVAIAPLPHSFPVEMRHGDGIRIVGLRAADAAAQRRLLSALDHTAQHETSYILLAGGGMYCSRAVLGDALTATVEGGGDPPEAVDFRLEHGFHIAADPGADLEGRPAFATAVRTTCLHSHAAAHVAHLFLQSGVTDEFAVRLLANDGTIPDAWRQVMREVGAGPHARPDRMRDFRRQQRDLRASIALAAKAMPYYRDNHKQGSSTRSDARRVSGLPDGSVPEPPRLLPLVAPGDGRGAAAGAVDAVAAAVPPPEAVPLP